MNDNFNFSNYHNPPFTSTSSPLAWLDPSLASDREHELSLKVAKPNLGPGSKQSLGQVVMNTTAPREFIGVSNISPLPTRTFVSEEQLSSHPFLMAHSPQYLGLFQAYIEATSELCALKAYSLSNNSRRPPSLPSRTNSIAPNHPTKPSTTKVSPLPPTTSLPQLKKEDHPDEVMWTNKVWSADERARKNNSQKVSLYDFLPDENGLPPSNDTIGEMRDAFKQACCRVELAGLRPRKWKRCVPEVLKYIHFCRV
ncbi:hypothetical protein BJ165DRAFT_1534091 [Panaeolus papilionaceus]|nr:hypothetical protein BJ165DRAFT_1534091 [Panaeolus papilionaceus]